MPIGESETILMVRRYHREIVFVLVQDLVKAVAVPPSSSLVLDFCQLLTRLTSRLRTSQVLRFSLGQRIRWW
jgi:hypothetical protein